MNVAVDWSVPPFTEIAVRRHTTDGMEEGRDFVAEEAPVALEYNGISHAVMLASPEYLEEFAIGFSLSEGIVARRSEIYECEVFQEPFGMRVAIRIANERFAALKERRRSLAGRTGCGLCGTESLAHAIRTPPAVTGEAAFAPATLHLALQRMQEQQFLQQKTGAVHAAAWIAPNGDIGLLREDVGRHNALDKLIGALVESGIDAAQGALIVTSRASYEMVQKAASAGVGLMAAISAPTALAVRLARQCNMTLVGFMRENRHVIYTHPHRIS